MKMSEKLSRIQDLVLQYIPIGEDGEIFREELQMVLDGKVPDSPEELPHKCIYVYGVCECGFKVEDHDKNYAPPKYDAYGLNTESELYKKIMTMTG